MKRPRKFKRRERKRSRPYSCPHDGVYVRCRGCQARRTLNRPLRAYLNRWNMPRCRDCGARDYRVDTYRERHERGTGAPRPCTCPQYHFPHRRASGFCIHNRNITEADEARRYGT